MKIQLGNASVLTCNEDDRRKQIIQGKEQKERSRDLDEAEGTGVLKENVQVW